MLKCSNKDLIYGIRTGKKIGDYYFIVIDLDDIWAKERIKDARFVETNKGIHRYLLIKELPKNCWLVNEEGKKAGELHSKGRQLVGIGSIHPSGQRYSLRGRVNVKFSLKFEN
ncbi:MAG: bifunctional DNA primase/polymerase [Spiroplasmataceae bacterium]|nr:bifunctional DNA primase/polymerase [Spiroplasmataceae bacterium]